MNRGELHRFGEICWRVISLCNSKSLKEGICFHSPVIKLGLVDDLYLNNNLLSLYAKCFGVDNARQFFDEMPVKDVVSWTGLVSAYTKNQKHRGALDVFSTMLLSAPSCPNAFTFSSVLRSCTALGEFRFGQRIHASVVKHGYDSNPVLVCSLMDLYSKLGSSEEGCKVFGDNVENGDIVSWTMMISCFVQGGEWSRSLRFYVDMMKAGVSPNEFTFVKVLGACGFLGLKCGELVHAHMIVLGIELNLVVKTALVDFYSRCLMIDDAISVSKLTSEQDVFSWTAIISGLARNLKLKEAVAAFWNMEISGILPNNVTYSSVISVCSSLASLNLGKQIHTRVVMACLEDDVSVGNALIDMYMKCSPTVDYGLRVFRQINLPNVISWTSLIAGFADHGFQEDSFNLALKMRAAGLQPNSSTLSTVLRACSIVKSASQTAKLHGYVIKIEADKDIVVANALVNAYAGSGKINDAWCVIKNMKQRDVITYTSLATRLNQMGNHELTFTIVKRMLSDDVKIDGFSLASFLSASSSLFMVKTGFQLHCVSTKSGLDKCISVSNALVSLYGKHGLVDEARQAFAEITEPDVVSWNSLISILASNDYISSALSTFDDMRSGGVKPDSVTFLSVLSACTDGGLVDLGLQYFHSMRKAHDIEPQLDHYICVVDLLGQAGRLEEAMEIIENLPIRPNALLYKTLLAACKVHKNVSLGEDIARRGLDLDPSNRAFYVLLAKLYDDSGWSALGEETRKLMRKKIGLELSRN